MIKYYNQKKKKIMVTKGKYQILEESKQREKNQKKTQWDKEEPKGNIFRKSKASMLKQQLQSWNKILFRLYQ